MKTVFLRALEADDKAAALRAAIREPEAERKQRFEVDTASFTAVPRSPFAYWVDERLRRLFKDLPPFEAEGRTAKIGLSTSDDFRFVRLWWEALLRRTAEYWFPFAKGGEFSPFSADVYLVVNWQFQGREMKAWVVANPTDPRTSHWSRRIANCEHFFRPGLTWPLRTNGLSFRAMPGGCIFGHKGPSVFVENNDSDNLLALASIANSRAFVFLVSLQLARTELAQSYEVGLIQNTPIPRFAGTDRNDLAQFALRAWSLKRSLDTCSEISHAFTLPAVLQVAGDDLAMRATAWSEHVRAIAAELATIQAKIDERCFELYGIDEADGRAITKGFTARTSDVESSEAEIDAEPEDEDVDEGEAGAAAAGLAAKLVSWAVGVAFGRFDLRLAMGARALPDEPEPFDPLPACSPAILIRDDGLPVASAPTGYPLTFPEIGILVDDPGHSRDLTAAVRAVFEEVFVATADARWNEAATLLDPKDHDLRAWLASSLFEHHLKRHSKSKRKAPIIWQLGTPSGRYNVWLYAHRLTRDSFFQIQNDVVGSKLAHEERQLTSLMQVAGGSPSAKERKEIAAQETFVGELRAMLDEVKRVTPLWNPTLDDGVVITMAPLWRLVPQHKPWQKELKSKWDELAAGKYDWAHIAMHLWPERVVPKCATDRSLAIAHGLEDVFWIEGKDGKWGRRSLPTRSLEEIVNERTSPAVKAALKSLLEAPLNAGTRGRGHREAMASRHGGDE